MKMNYKKLLAGLVGALCLFALVISPVSAGMGMGAGNGSAADCAGDCDQTRDQIRDQIRDPTCNQTCTGDCDQARDQIRDQIRDPTCNQTCAGDCDQTRDQTCDRTGNQQIETRLAMLEEQGIDVTDIRAALESGDRDTVRTLMAEPRGECMQEGAENCFVKGNGSGAGSGSKFQGRASTE